MEKEKIKSGVKSALPYIIASAAQVPIFAFNPNIFNALVFLTNAGFGYMNYKNGLSKHDSNKLMESPIYKEYVDLYNEFVRDIARMFKDLGINKGIEAVVCYKLCLDNGIFSATGENKYALFEDDKDFLIKELGGRVATGKNCCRHNASFLSDIINNMGGLSPKISVYYDSVPNKKLLLAPNHLVSGIIHNNKRLMIDPTTNYDFLFSNGIVVDNGEKALFRRVCENGAGIKYTIVSGGFDNGSLYDDKYEEFLKFEPVTDSTEILDDYMEALVTSAVNINEFNNFHEEEKPKILQLSYLSQIVTPRGKEIINE